MNLSEEQRKELLRLVRRGMILALHEAGLLTGREQQLLLADDR
ncbi:hypothetical protein [Agathobaculum sp.]|nr:hypothetical protein [Agathobaculum sp.]MDY3618340.1 hypothetical protein [Agathobaculum sp.]